MRSISRLFTRQNSCTVLLVGAFICALFFTGAGAKLVVLMASCALLLLSLAVSGSRVFANSFQANPKASMLALATILLVCVLYQFSISRDTSFPVSWVFIALPLTFILAVFIREQSRGGALLQVSILSLVTVLAVYSDLRFFFYGERAHLPIIDPNNFATLIYLVWVPFVHFMLFDAGEIFTASRLKRITGYLISLILLCALFATQSRMGVYLSGAALLVWVYLVLTGRIHFSRLVPQLSAWVLALVLVGDLGPAVISDGTGQGSVSAGLDIRLLMIEAAIRMYADYPWLGTGLLGFGMLYPSYRVPEEQGTAGLFVHNDYVQVLTEGGLPLLFCLLLFVISVGLTCLALLRRETSKHDLSRLGYGMALGAASGHALINFVFYSLPLMILMGMVSAFLLKSALSDKYEEKISNRIKQSFIPVYWGGLLFGFCAWLFLLLDVSILGVFMGQKGVPWVDHIKSDEQGTLEFSRFAQNMNDNRGLPYLGEATLLNRFAIRQPDNAEARIAAFRKLSEAQSRDSLNPAVYVEMAKHMDNFQAAYRDSRPVAQMEALLMKALELDPINIPATDYLMAIYAALGTPQRSIELLNHKIAPWFELLGRRDGETLERYLEILLQDALTKSETDANAIKALREKLRAI